MHEINVFFNYSLYLEMIPSCKYWPFQSFVVVQIYPANISKLCKQRRRITLVNLEYIFLYTFMWYEYEISISMIYSSYLMCISIYRCVSPCLYNMIWCADMCVHNIYVHTDVHKLMHDIIWPYAWTTWYFVYMKVNAHLDHYIYIYCIWG